MKKINHILADVLLGRASDEERLRYEAWKALSDQNRSFAEGLEEYWRNPVRQQDTAQIESARRKLLDYINQQEKRSLPPTLTGRGWSLSRIAVAAGFAVAVSAVSFLIATRWANSRFSTEMAVSTQAGQQSRVRLPDGSTVWLNSETEIRFSAGHRLRLVELTGEASFDVARKTSVPFVVDAGGVFIEVLGTKFNVSRYPDSDRIETSLLEGSIEMSLPGFDKDIRIQPGEKVAYNPQKKQYTKSLVNVNNDILWQNGILFFENEPFDRLVRRIERYYAVKFIYDPADFVGIHYTGSINNLSIDKVLEFLDLTIPIRYTIDNKTIRLDMAKTGRTRYRK